MMKGYHRLRTSFTLVELLVVVAIITILMCLLLPALKGVVATAQKITCANNFKQLYLGAVCYVDNYNGYLAPDGGYGWEWSRHIATAMDPNFPWVIPDSTMGSNTAKAFLCPAQKPVYGANNAPFPAGVKGTATYQPTLTCTTKATIVWVDGQYGGWLPPYEYISSTAVEAKKFSHVWENSVMLVEKPYYDLVISDTIARAWQYNLPYYTNTLGSQHAWKWGASYRHAMSANFVFKDGHVAGYPIGSQFSPQWQPDYGGGGFFPQ